MVYNGNNDIMLSITTHMLRSMYGIYTNIDPNKITQMQVHIPYVEQVMEHGGMGWFKTGSQNHGIPEIQSFHHLRTEMESLRVLRP